MGTISDKVGQAKAWYASKTIIGIVLAFIPTIVKLVKPEYVLDIEGVLEEGFTAAEIIANTSDQIWATILEIGGTLLAIWGRIKAKVQLK